MSEVTLSSMTQSFRQKEAISSLCAKIALAVNPDRTYRFMEFCGGHTHVLSRWGLADLLPENIQMIHGPGCPVCVLPIGRINLAIDLALHHDVILCSYADAMRVPASKGLSLMSARSLGADIRMVYSPMDALALAKKYPDKEVVFFAIGFETTTPPTAIALQSAIEAGLDNLSFLVSHVLTPVAMNHILARAEDLTNPHPVKLDGIVGPAHVSSVIGTNAYREISQKWRIPIVITGFEPVDMALSILMLVNQVNESRADIENEFTRAVSERGNTKAQALIETFFTLREAFEWRGLGTLAHSALRLKDEYACWDAEKRYDLKEVSVPDNKACQCGAILRGEKAPKDCPVFGTACTPAMPLGACMVSSEGACAAYYSYARVPIKNNHKGNP